MPHELFSAGLHARGIFPELKQCFYKELSYETFEDFLVTKFGLWIDTRSSTSKKRSILLRIKKAAESSDGDLKCYLFSFEDVVTHLAVSNLSRILAFEK